MRMWTVYSNPSDFPGHYVVRGWTVTREDAVPDPDPTAVGVTLEYVRSKIPRFENLYRMPASRWDDPTIVEVWL